MIDLDKQLNIRFYNRRRNGRVFKLFDFYIFSKQGYKSVLMVTLVGYAINLMFGKGKNPYE